MAAFHVLGLIDAGGGTMNLLTVLLILVSPALQADPASVAQLVQERYEQAASLRCDFRQIYRSGATGKLTENTGELAMKKPGKMRWDYKTPEDKLYISDGETVYWYLPADRQVTRMKLSDTDQQQTQIRFLMGEGDLVRDFTITDASADLNELEYFILHRYRDDLPDYEGSFFLRMLPKQEEDYDYLIMVVNPKDYDVERLLVFDSLGNCTDYMFLMIERPQISDDFFKFTIPRGVEVFDER
jgi:outer membrane lipoprotein carrier protein